MKEDRVAAGTEAGSMKPVVSDKSDGDMMSPAAASSESVDGFLNSFTPTTIASSAVKETRGTADESDSDADDDSVEYLQQISAQEDDESPDALSEEDDDGDDDDDEDGEEVGPAGIRSFVGANGERFSSFNLKVISHPFRTGKKISELNFCNFTNYNS